MPNEVIPCYPLSYVIPCVMYKSDWPTASYLQKYICPAGMNQWLPFHDYSFMASNVRKVGWLNSWTGLLFGLTNLSLLGKFANIPTFDIVGPGYIVARSFYLSNDSPRDRAGHGHSQWEPTLQCNVVSHWLSSYPEWPLLPINKSMFVDFIYNHKQWWDIVCLLSCYL